MFNVLPDILKQEIQQEYKLRRFFVGLILFFFAQISFLIFLFPSWFISYYREMSVANEVALSQQSALAKNVNSVSDIVLGTNQKLQVITQGFYYIPVTPVFDSLLSIKTDGVQIVEFSQTSVSPKTARVHIKGVSKDRESLVLFVKALQKSKLFSATQLPVSNLAKEKNIVFTLEVEISQ